MATFSAICSADLATKPGSSALRPPDRGRAAVHARHQPAPGQRVDVAADGHVRDAEQLDQLGDPGGAVLGHLLEDAVLALAGEHGHRSLTTATAPAGRVSTGHRRVGHEVVAVEVHRGVLAGVVDQEQPRPPVAGRGGPPRPRPRCRHRGGDTGLRRRRWSTSARVAARSRRVAAYQAPPVADRAPGQGGTPGERAVGVPGQHLGVVGRAGRSDHSVPVPPSSSATVSPAGSGKNSSTRTPSRSRKAPG